MLLKYLAAGALAIACAIVVTAPPAVAQDFTRQLTHIKGDVWRFQNKFHFSVVINTDEGVVVTDPINRDAAKWLAEIIASRFAKPVIYLVYSHSHQDHAEGGEYFADTATVIAHENAPETIYGVPVDVRVGDEMTFTAGRHSFELTYLGPGHGDDLLAMVIRPENVAFIVDVVAPGRLPFKNFEGVDIAGLIEQIKKVESLDFEIIAPGHSRLGTKADATAEREYVEWLRGAVAEALRSGMTEDQVVEQLDTSAYSDWLAYDNWRRENIRGMARWLKASGEVQ